MAAQRPGAIDPSDNKWTAAKLSSSPLGASAAVVQGFRSFLSLELILQTQTLFQETGSKKGHIQAQNSPESMSLKQGLAATALCCIRAGCWEEKQRETGKQRSRKKHGG